MLSWILILALAKKKKKKTHIKTSWKQGKALEYFLHKQNTMWQGGRPVAGLKHTGKEDSGEQHKAVTKVGERTVIQGRTVTQTQNVWEKKLETTQGKTRQSKENRKFTPQNTSECN